MLVRIYNTQSISLHKQHSKHNIDLVLYGHNPYTGKDLELKTTVQYNMYLYHKVISPIKDGDLVTVYINKSNEKQYIVDLRDFYRWSKRS